MKPVHWRHALGRRDAGWCLRANRWCSRGRARPFFAEVSRLGDGAAWYALMGLLLVFDGIQGLFASVHLGLTGVIALALYRLLKRYTQRPRPFVFDARIRALVAPLDEFSFPSGHTLHAVAFSLVAVAHYPLLVWVLAPFTATVAISRVVLGLHYPSDVLAAIVLGASIAAASMWIWPVPI